jgi:hypothetical protein
MKLVDFYLVTHNFIHHEDRPLSGLSITEI